VKVLITLTDVEPAVRLNARLEQAGIEAAVVSPLDDMQAALKRERPRLVVLTGALLDAGNVHLVRQLQWDGIAVIGLADVRDPSIDERLRAIGYADVFAKPIVLDEVFDAVRRILDRLRLADLTGLYGDSAAVREVLVRVEQMAPVSSTVLIAGESGTGKELVARAIHRLGPRRNKPFIAVSVGALPETLLESELFGHEKGAFTGAAERRLGRFELADGGTLFLDEIGDIPHSTQVKLLRVLEEREVTRIGGARAIPVNVRVVAATNRPLREAVEEGSFRADLYYRLNVLSIYLPPLRERKSDIPMLVRRFISQFSREHDRPFRGVSAEAMELLVGYPWPGNVRELRNLVESMVVLAPGREIGPDDIPRQIRERAGMRFLPVRIAPAAPVPMSEGQAGGRELAFIVQKLVELQLQVEELKRQMSEARLVTGSDGGVSGWYAEGGELSGTSTPGAGRVLGLEPRDTPAPPNTVVVTPGMTMAAIERAAIDAALRETRGNRRRAAELLGIGERTLYRKLREYEELASGELD
jgi:DNA-binding NtrC family response regulator